MMGSRTFKSVLAGSVCALALSTVAMAQDGAKTFDVPAGDLGTALDAYIKQSGEQLIYRVADVRGMRTSGVRGALTSDAALQQLLAGTSLKVQRDPSGLIAVASISTPQSASAAGDGADGTVAALVVTAQKREENIQDVPIAMSAFTQEDLTRSQVAGGPDLMTQVPNFTFTKTNFSSYSIQIRGIGTQAISATVDPAVAVAFNNTPFVRNRFFEQEFYDLERVEVLRGPQGTLYGRNATAGVVNIISAKPKFDYEARLSADVANYGSSRLEGMVNLPLVEDKVALRLAGAWTKRDGFVTNALSGKQTDGRGLWSTRLSLGFHPADSIKANLIWEHFEEDDDRLRSGKQLCRRDPGLSELDGVTLSAQQTNILTQGCLPSSLYSPDSFQVPNGYALPFYGALEQVSFPAALGADPYSHATQSSDLRVIETSIKPVYKAKADIGEFQFDIDVTPSLTLTSETAYGADEVYSFEDFNRFETARGAFGVDDGFGPELVARGALSPEGVFCDPQLGCSDRLVVGDLSTGEARQFSQELRVASRFDGPFNFTAGANFFRSDSVDKYYVFFNSLALFSVFSNYYEGATPPPYVVGQSDNSWCLNALRTSSVSGKFASQPLGCKYMDPNPISNLNDNGRQYFLSKNPYRLISYAVFGEAEYQISPELTVTAGLRWTVDKKHAPLIPSWLLVPESYGLPVASIVKQEWREPTGRAVVEWRPKLGFTDETLIYGSFSRGYKAGGVNPPIPANGGMNVEVGRGIEASHPSTFKPEFVNAYELGAKNTLANGALTLNADAFYYDYTGYQISQIVDRSAINLNFDAKVWGAELELSWTPLENLRLGLKAGYENTRLADGSRAIDTMDRTAGDPNWVVAKPYATTPSNCIVPSWYVTEGWPLTPSGATFCELAYYQHLDPGTSAEYTPYPYGPDGYRGFNPDTAPNNGAGISKDLSGNALPNAPHFTGTITADYTAPLANGWLMTLHSDLYYQSEAWTRIFNMPGYDKLKAYTNVNLAAIFANEDAGWQVMAYIKNVFDRDSITGAFLNSDDTGLTTNVFLTEPRLYGLRVTKSWTGAPSWLPQGRSVDGLYPFTVQLAGSVLRHDAPSETMSPVIANEFPKAISPFGVENENLDWGDGRDLSLTWKPRSSTWSLSAGVRFGRTNGSNRVERKMAGPTGCTFGYPIAFLCDQHPDQLLRTATDYGIGTVFDHEEHTVADFAVGKDVGLGFGKPVGMRAGLRYANLRSDTASSIHGIPDWQLPEEWVSQKYSQHHVYESSVQSRRTFEGFGPTLGLDGAQAVLGGAETGSLNLDWSLTAGVLFGRQKTSTTYKHREAYYSARYTAVHPTPEQEQTSSTSRHASRSVTVPVVDLSLGVSYAIDRTKVGVGYRWERYFDAIDGGIQTARSYDRTIDGPYFKVSLGFGG